MAYLDLKDLIKKFDDYLEAAAYVNGLVEKGKIAPVGKETNGRRPPLYKRYKELKPKEDNSAYVQELETKIMPPLSSAWYLRHIAQYKKDREYILRLNAYLLEHGLPDSSAPEISINERSFEIWQNEKYLKEHIDSLSRNLAFPKEKFHIYPTYEPLISYYSSNTHSPQNILIVENLDSFVSIRKNMLEGQREFMGTSIDTVIYGAGKKIISSFRDLVAFGMDYLKAPENTFYYLGDLDYEGIQIFNTFVTRYPDIHIELFVPGYLFMMEKGAGLPLRQMAENQKEPDAPNFWQSFLPEYEGQAQSMKALLKKRKYIPQEIITREDWMKGGHKWTSKI